MTLPDQIAALNACYVQHSGMESRMYIGGGEKERAWCEFIKAGFTEDDLKGVLSYLRLQIAKGERKPACLRFSSLVGDLMRFEEEISLRKTALLSKKPSLLPKEKLLAELRRQPKEPVEIPSPQATRDTLEHIMDQFRRSAD